MSAEVSFDELAAAAGVKHPGLYYAREVSRATGATLTAINSAVRGGHLRSFLPPGQKQGRLFAAEWVDEWMRAGTSLGAREEGGAA